MEDVLGRKHRRQWSVAEKRRIVAEATRPGTNKAALARRHGISDSQLYSWRKVLGNETPTPFLPVITDPALSRKDDATSGSIDIILSNGHRLIVSGSVNPGHVERLLHALAST